MNAPLSPGDDWAFRRATLRRAPRRPAHIVGNAWEFVARVPPGPGARRPWAVLRSLLTEHPGRFAWARIDYPPGGASARALSMFFGVLSERVGVIRWSASAPPGIVRVAWEFGS